MHRQTRRERQTEVRPDIQTYTQKTTEHTGIQARIFSDRQNTRRSQTIKKSDREPTKIWAIILRNRQTQADRQIKRQIRSHTYRQTEKQSDRLAHTQTEQQKNRHGMTDIHT